MTPWFFSASIDYLKILGNPWINQFLNFPYDIIIRFPLHKQSLKILECANNRDCLLLATLQYLMYITLFPGRVILFITVIVYHVTKPEGNRAGYVSRSNFRKKNQAQVLYLRPKQTFQNISTPIFWNEIQVGTVFPHIVSAETILF